MFFQIPQESIPGYNEERDANWQIIINNGGRLQTGGCIWFKGKILADVGTEHFAEDFSFPIRLIRNCKSQNIIFLYSLKEIDKITDLLGILWETSKDVPFNSVIGFTGLSWDLDQKSVALPEVKREKYNQAISDWHKQPTHTLEGTCKLYGKLLYACHIVPRGQAYLTNLKKMMGTFHECPFTPRHSPKHLTEDLTWWQKTLSQPSLT